MDTYTETREQVTADSVRAIDVSAVLFDGDGSWQDYRRALEFIGRQYPYLLAEAENLLSAAGVC